MTYLPPRPPIALPLSPAEQMAQLEVEKARAKLRNAVEADIAWSTVDSHIARAEAAAEFEMAVARYHALANGAAADEMRRHELQAMLSVKPKKFRIDWWWTLLMLSIALTLLGHALHWTE